MQGKHVLHGHSDQIINGCTSCALCMKLKPMLSEHILNIHTDELFKLL